MPLIDCLDKAKEAIPQAHKDALTQKAEAYQKEGMSQDNAERRAVQEYVSQRHQDLHDQVNQLRKKAGLKPEAYEPLSFHKGTVEAGKQLEMNFTPKEVNHASDWVDENIHDPNKITDGELHQWGEEALNELKHQENEPNATIGEPANEQPASQTADAQPERGPEAAPTENGEGESGTGPASEVAGLDPSKPSETEQPGTEGSPEVTGIKNAVTKAEREARGQSEVVVSELKRSFGKAFDEGKRLVDEGHIDPRIMAEQLADKPRPLSAEESAALIYDRMRLSNEHRQVVAGLNSAMESGDEAASTIMRSRLVYLEEAMNTNDIAARKTGYEQGLGLAARRMMISQDYSLAHQIQVMRTANGGEPLSDALRMKLEGYSKELEQAYEKIRQHEEKISRLEADKEIAGLREAEKKVKQQSRQIKREDNKKVRETAIASIKEKLRTQRSQLNANPVPVEIIPDLVAIAKSYIKDGIIKADELIEKVHGDVKDFLEGATVRDIRDAISGYGKVKQLSKDELDTQLRDLKSQMRELSKLEDLERNEVPKRSGMQRDKPSDETRELRRKVYQKMKEAGITGKTTEDAQRTALDALKARLRNQIADLTKQIDTGEKSPKKVGVSYDEEATQLKEQRDNLKKALEEIEGKPELSDEQRIKIATAAVEKSIQEYERRIAEKDVNPAKKESKTPETPELKTLREKRDALKQTYQDMVDEATPKKTPEEIALQAYKTRLLNRKADLEDKMSRGDYSIKQRNKIIVDQEGLKLQNEVEKIKDKFDAERKRIELANRSVLEKGFDALVKWRRGVALTGITTLGKLGSAAGGRLVLSPIEEIYGGVLSQIPGIKAFADKAPREGGFNIHAEAQSIAKTFTMDTLQNMLDILKTGKSKEDRLFGKKREEETGWFKIAIDFFGRIHGAIKYVAKKAEITRAFEKRLSFAAKNGFDVTDPVVQSTLWSQSYMDAQRSIFMNDNLATKGYNGMLGFFERSGNTGKVVAGFARMLLPIVKVPTNFVLETSHYAFGVPKAVASIAYALTKGMQNVSPEHADYIMRMLKKGSIGAALFAVGYLNPEHFGGYYTGKRDEDDKQPKDMDLFGVTIQHWAQHLPVLEVMQLGATIRRVKDAYEEKHDDENGLNEGIIKGSVGLIGETPFFDQSKRAIESAESGKKFNYYWGEFTKSAIDPQIIQEIAQQLDKEDGQVVKRDPQTIIQHVETGIPFLRNTVPAKEDKSGGGLTRSLLP